MQRVEGQIQAPSHQENGSGCSSPAFFRNQFKRSVRPTRPKSARAARSSPRGDWRAPSDGSASAWLADLAKVPAKEG